jgi:endonuclease VIII
MPEGDALHRAAERLRVLEGEVVAVETPHPRAAVLRLAERLDGRRLERVQAVGKNLVLDFEGGLVLRSHLRMRGRWRVQAAGQAPFGTPWLVLRGRERQAVLWNGSVLELTRGRSPAVSRLGPDVMADPPDIDGILQRLRATRQSREVGEALLDQRLVAGIGNMWKAEALFAARTSPWRRLSELDDAELRRVLEEAVRLMQSGERGRHRVYRRAGRSCATCGTLIRSLPQGDDARTGYWCPGCQAGTSPAGA